MRIGIYDPYLDSMSGGERYMLTAASCLSDKNEVDLFWDDGSILALAHKKLNIDLNKVNIMPNIFSTHYSFINRLKESGKYDLLFILSDGSIPVTLSKKTILHFQHPFEWIKGLDIKTKIKLSRINSFICNSEFTKNFIDKEFNIKSLVIYPPCIGNSEAKKNMLNYHQKAKKNIIFSVGRYNRLGDGSSMKKFEIMIDVFKNMVDKGLMRWELVLAISFLDENKKLVEELEKNLKSYPITLIKNCKYEELEKLYNRSKIYWHSAGFGEDLDKHPERAEHFGITIVEAMSFGVVPVVFRGGGLPEIVDDKINGLLWETQEELMDLTKKIMIDDDLRGQMAGLGFEKVKQFTTEKFCERLLKIIL